MINIEEIAKKKHDISSTDWSHRHYKKLNFSDINTYDIRYRLKEACRLYNKNPKKPDLSLLDVGCGDGYFLSQVEARYKIGIDTSAKMIERACSLYPKTKFTNENIYNLKETSYFDIVTCLGVIQYNQDLHKFLKSIRDALQNNGTLLISFPNNKSIFRRINGALKKDQTQYAHSFKEFMGVCKSLGLEITYIRSHTFGFYLMPRFLRPLNMLMNILFDKILWGEKTRSYFGLSYFCEFKKISNFQD